VRAGESRVVHGFGRTRGFCRAGPTGTGTVSDFPTRGNTVPVTGNPRSWPPIPTLVVAVPLTPLRTRAASRAGMVAGPTRPCHLCPPRAAPHTCEHRCWPAYMWPRAWPCVRTPLPAPACPAASVPSCCPAHVPLSLCCLSCAWGNHHAIIIVCYR